MIKFENVSEISDVKSDNTNAYLSIRPTEKMSDQDVGDLISKEFENARDVTEFDTYDKLLSDVFNRSEEELDIDFPISDDVQAILGEFEPENWNTKDDAERIELLDALGQTIGIALGLEDIPQINITDNDDRYGFYNPTDNSITLNGQFFHDPIELVNTLAHEMRHAYQHIRADALETREDALYRVNFDNYITPIPLPEGGYLLFFDYERQYVEVDARAFADKFMEAMV